MPTTSISFCGDRRGSRQFVPAGVLLPRPTTRSGERTEERGGHLLSPGPLLRRTEEREWRIVASPRCEACVPPSLCAELTGVTPPFHARDENTLDCGGTTPLLLRAGLVPAGLPFTLTLHNILATVLCFNCNKKLSFKFRPIGRQRFPMATRPGARVRSNASVWQASNCGLWANYCNSRVHCRFGPAYVGGKAGTCPRRPKPRRFCQAFLESALPPGSGGQYHCLQCGDESGNNPSSESVQQVFMAKIDAFFN